MFFKFGRSSNAALTFDFIYFRYFITDLHGVVEIRTRNAVLSFLKVFAKLTRLNNIKL